MARPQKISNDLRRAEKREAGLRSIDENLDLGNGLTLTAYSRQIQHCRATLSLYNMTVAKLDDLSRQLRQEEQALREMTAKMLLGTGAKFGTDSREYGQAGGTPKSERRRPSPRRKARSTAAQTSQPDKSSIGSSIELPIELLSASSIANAEAIGAVNGKGRG